MKSLRISIISFALLATIAAVNVTLQIAVMRDNLTNQIINKASVNFFDAFGYEWKGRTAGQQGDFYEAFNDGYNMPGYPLFLALLYRATNSPLLTARYLQVFLGGVMIIISFFTLRNFISRDILSVIGVLPVAAWIPFYYFAQILYPESLSIFLVSALICLVSSYAIKTRHITIITMAVCLASLIYLKPNHLLMYIPLIMVIWFINKQKKKAILFTLILSFSVLGMILPWSIWVSSATKTFIPLTTAQGWSLYMGTGAGGIDGDDPAHPSIAKNTLEWLKLNEIPQEEVIKKLKRAPRDKAPSVNRISMRAALRRWYEMPFQTSIYGVSKVLHAFGFSFRDIRDIILATLSIAAIGFSIFLWRIDHAREICLFFWGMTGISFLQAFIFLPAQRFKTVSFDLPALLIITLGVAEILKNYPPSTVKNARNKIISTLER